MERGEGHHGGLFLGGWESPLPFHLILHRVRWTAVQGGASERKPFWSESTAACITTLEKNTTFMTPGSTFKKNGLY